MKVIIDLQEEYKKIKDQPIDEVKSKESIFWLVHPEIDRREPVSSWMSFLESVDYENNSVFLILSKLMDKGLENYLKTFKDKEKIYTGGFIGNGVSYLHERDFPDHDHYLLGWRFGYCVNKQADYLLDVGVPEEKITVLRDYSFCCGKERCLEETEEKYNEKGIEVYSGSLEGLS